MKLKAVSLLIPPILLTQNIYGIGKEVTVTINGAHDESSVNVRIPARVVTRLDHLPNNPHEQIKINDIIKSFIDYNYLLIMDSGNPCILNMTDADFQSVGNNKLVKIDGYPKNFELPLQRENDSFQFIINYELKCNYGIDGNMFKPKMINLYKKFEQLVIESSINGLESGKVINPNPVN